MIRRYDFGHPYQTGAIANPVPVCTDSVPHFDVRAEDGKVVFTRTMDDDDMIFGLGENVRGINKRGHLYRAWNSDDFSHTENKASLYASHNFLMFYSRKEVFGVFVDDPGAITFDLGYTDGGLAIITAEHGDCSFYVISGENAVDVVRQFRCLTGRSYIPPKWGFGYIQSRWGYVTEEDLRTVDRKSVV